MAPRPIAITRQHAAWPPWPESARATQCLNNLRQLGLAVRLYADDNADEFPRSQHSAFANGLMPWERTVAPLVGSSTMVSGLMPMLW